MKIAGLQKMTLLDYPGKVACTVFLGGCNFRCPFCHNSSLLSASAPEEMTPEQLLSFLKKRQGLLDGVCITGGEPTLSPDLGNLLEQIKVLGFSVKLDTNGTNPRMLKELVRAGLIDYVAMDIKNSPRRYPQTAGIPGLAMEKIEESMAFLLTGSLEYEFRTTVVEELHEEADFTEIGLWLKKLAPDHKAKRFFLQCYRDTESVLLPGLHTPDSEKLHRFARLLRPFVDSVEIRGIE